MLMLMLTLILILFVNRFPCCGKVFPCNVCHDSTEDHPMERANRMIRGYCSKEQVNRLLHILDMYMYTSDYIIHYSNRYTVVVRRVCLMLLI